jgi:hypothetical protein
MANASTSCPRSDASASSGASSNRRSSGASDTSTKDRTLVLGRCPAYGRVDGFIAEAHGLDVYATMPGDGAAPKLINSDSRKKNVRERLRRRTRRLPPGQHPNERAAYNGNVSSPRRTLGKGEVVCSIHTGSTRAIPLGAAILRTPCASLVSCPLQPLAGHVRPRAVAGATAGPAACRALASAVCLRVDPAWRRRCRHGRSRNDEGRRWRDAPVAVLARRCQRVRRLPRLALRTCRCRWQSCAASGARARCAQGQRATGRP